MLPLATSIFVASTLLLKPLPLAPLSHAVRSACATLGTDVLELEPEDVAWMAAQAIASMDPAQQDGDCLLQQGELLFNSSVAHADRFCVAEPLALAGDARAMQTLGLLHFSGVGGAQCDLHESARWHGSAAASGNIDALATLGGCVFRGAGAEQDAQRGLQLIEAAAAAGSAVGLTKLGVLYDEGTSELTGGASDPWRAAKHFEAAAATGSALGLFNLGWALVHGIGTGRDVVRGLELWREAAALAPEDGSEEAAYYIYEERHLMSAELSAAVRPARCLRLAAGLGFD